MASTTVAAIVPLYNGASFITGALQSVLKQTQMPDEIIVVDDGSTDEGPAIVQEMASSYPIRLLTKPNGGQSSARNMGISACKSSHIALLDQDDLWYEDHLQRLKEPFLRGTVASLALVYGNLDHIDRDGRMVLRNLLDHHPMPQPKLSRSDCLSQDMFILPSASLFEKEAFLQVGAFDERLSGYEDDDLFTRMFSAGYRSVYLNRAVSQWRIYSASASYSRRMMTSRMIYFDKLTKEYPDDPALGHYWTRDCIGPRFLKSLYANFYDAAIRNDVELMERLWADMEIVTPVLRRKPRRRLQMVAPFMRRACRSGRGGVARALLRAAVRREVRR